VAILRLVRQFHVELEFPFELAEWTICCVLNVNFVGACICRHSIELKFQNLQTLINDIRDQDMSLNLDDTHIFVDVDTLGVGKKIASDVVTAPCYE
jgi:hypothetical protein